MTAGKFRRRETMALLEDAFGTPAGARGGMMTVAGATDQDEELPLLTDEEVNESSKIRIRIGVLRMFVQEVIAAARP